MNMKGKTTQDKTKQDAHVKATHRDSTSAAQHKTQGKRKTGRWKIDVRRRRGRARDSSLFAFSQIS